MMAHAPISAIAPSAAPGQFHAAMTVPEWPAVYNGGWDVVASPIGDFVSSTDQQASYLVEPTYGFVRQFGTWLADEGAAPPRIVVESGIPQTGEALRVRVNGLADGTLARLRIGSAPAVQPEREGDLGAVYVPRRSMLVELEASVTGGSAVFTLAAAPAAERLAMFAWQRAPSGVRKSPTAVVHVRKTGRLPRGDAATWTLPDHFEHDGTCCGMK